MKKFAIVLAGLIVLGLAAFWLLTMPSTVPASALSMNYVPSLANGETMFDIGGCAACHMTEGQKDRHQLGGGLALASPFGVFHAPNISMAPQKGIGNWTELEFVNALVKGVGRNGEHLYPALPYTSYDRMKLSDVRDLYAYMKTLPAVDVASKPHEIGFPFNIRRLLGGWKLLFVHDQPFVADASKSAEWNRGAYLVNGPGHCAECHSPRNQLGAIKEESRFAGAPDVEGQGWVPNITPHEDGLKDWTAADMAEFLSSGMTPEFDSAGGSMAEVIQNTSRLSDADRQAMAVYLHDLPPRPGKAPAKTAAE